jgi:hypothetical protein
MNSEFATLYGILLGDGCLSTNGKGYFISICGHAEDDYSFFQAIRPLISLIRMKNTPFRIRKEQGKVEYNFSDKKLFYHLISVGFPVGKKGVDLEINPVFEDYKKEVISGIFATDGCLVITKNNGIIYPRIEISSISQTLLKQIRSYLNSISIKSGIYISKKASGHWNKLYRLQSNGNKNLTLFESSIGFLNPKHKKKYGDYTQKYNAGEGIRAPDFHVS